MSHWEVKFDGADPGPSDDFVLKFMRIEDVLNEEDRFTLVDKYVADIVGLVKSNDHYNVIGNLKEIVSPTGEDLTRRKIWAFMGVHTGTGNELKIGSLLAQYKDDSWGILGLWPDPFAAAVKEDITILKGLLMAFIEKPGDWERVDIVQPGGAGGTPIKD